MSRPVTLASLIDSVRKRADIDGLTIRHTDVWLATEINRSWQMLRSMVTKQGNPMFLKWTTGTTSVGPKSGYAFGELTLPADLLEIHAIDVTVASNDIRSLVEISISERNSYLSRTSDGKGTPEAFFLEDMGVETTTTVAPGHIALLPAPDRAYAYSIGYVPSWTDIASSNTTYVFESIGQWDEWVIWDVVLKVCGRDNDMQNCAAIAQAERERVWQKGILPAARVQAVGARQRVDVAGTSLVARRRAR